MFINGAWGTVCDDGWDLKDANVVCRQLGFQRALTAVKAAASGRGQGKISIKNVQCTGDESSLRYCGHTIFVGDNCTHSNDAGVVCSSGKMNSLIQCTVGEGDTNNRLW